MVELHSIISEKQRHDLNIDSPVPLYYRLYKLLKSCILDGTYTEGMQLPTEQQLSNEFGVSRITSKRALDELAVESLVERRRGKGTHVTHQYQQQPLHSPMVGLLQEIESIGKQSSAEVLDSGILRPPREIRETLGLSTDDTALYLARVRSRNKQRFGYYESWTLGVKLPGNLNVFRLTPRMSYFRKKGLQVHYTKQIISAVGATPEVADVLGILPGSPLLSLTRLTYKEKHSDNKPVDYLKVLYHPGRFEYHIDLELEGLT
ncbi:MAG: GntR family transcriptional regulator [Lysobacterales bacterium]|jgi:GntR family transcriptional regulator